MDNIRPFMLQDNYNGEGNETQVEFSVEQSVSSLMQQSVDYLRNEITQLENIIISKTKEFKELNLNCARQVANISDQTMDLEHLKIKIEHEEINRESRFEKVCDYRENCKRLEKYFTTWVNAINQMMLSVDKLKELTKEVKIKKDHEKGIVIFHQRYSQHSVNQAKEAIMLLNLLGVQEEREFNKLQNRFKNEINKDKEKILEKQIQFQELEARLLQKNTMLKMLNSANVDLKNNFEVLNEEKESELDKIKPTLFKLESILNAEIIKGEQLNCGIGVFDSLSKEVNSCLGDLEIDVHNFNTKQKQLISKEEQYKEILKTLINTTCGLSLEVEALKIKFSKCLIVNDHNVDLKKKLDDLLEINDNQINNITNLVKTEQTFEEDLLNIDKTISNMVNMTHSIISKQLLVKHQNEQLLKKQKNDIYEHEKISLGFEEDFGRLSEEHNILDSEMIKLKESMYDASNITNMQVNILEHLETKYNKLHNIFEEGEHKLNKQVEYCGSVTKNVLENIICLNGMIFRAEEAYQQAQCNMHFNIYLKGQNDYLNSELLQQQYIHMKSIKETKETHAYKLESKTKEMEDSRKIHERLFRNKEQNKTDALVELKENRIKIADLKCQEDNLNYELKRMEKKLFKCENLLLSLENKLNVVAHVATEVSQSVADSASQNTIPVKPAKKVNLVDDWGFGS